ncbi:hypothetical protein BFP78_10295 [Gaetbulibacter sp. 5U11]|nr:hypothetical protein BFP78_10295 [Gaetbulibacter sp. 5U11]
MRNFRDASKFNFNFKKGLVCRGAIFDFLRDDYKLLEELNINTVIDLRADREVETIFYSEKVLSRVNYVNAYFDPWNQPEWFQEKYSKGSNEEIAYRFFAMGCKESVRKTFETILEHESGAIAIHCHAGKDRTGIIFSMLHLLLGSPIGNLYTDYLASEMDVSKEKLNIALDIIEKEGGIESYLLSCGLSEDQVLKLKHKLLNEK